MSVHGKILRGVSGGVFFSLVTIVVTFVQLRLVLDFLSPSLAGTWLLFISVGSYIAFFDLGLSPTIAREIGFHLGTERHDHQHKIKLIADLLATSNYLFRFLSIVVFLLAVLLGGYIVHTTTSPAQYSQVAWAWFIFSTGAALNLWASSPFAALYGLGYLGSERLIRSLSLLLGLVLTITLLYAGFGIVGLAVAWAAQGLLSRLIAKQVLHQRYPDLLTVQSKANLQLAKAILIPSLKWAIMGFGAILILQTDNVIIATILGPASIPNYEAVAKIAITTMSIALLLVTAVSPHISKAYAEKNLILVTSLLSQSVRLSVSMVAFLAAFVAVFGDAIIALWLGSGKFVGFPILWTLLLMVLLEAHHVAMATATVATGHMVFAKPALIAGLLNLIISVILAHHLGLWGVALGTLIAQALTNNWYAPYVALKYFGVPFSTHLKTVLMPTAVLLVVLLVTNLLLKYLLSDYTNLIMLTIAFVFSVMIAASVSYIFVLTKGERQAMQNYLFFNWGKKL
jgi:O-antigen/teichoic acid export membrane protein